MTEGDTGRERLLAAAIDDVAAHGVGNRSLRQIAAALDTSHRMLIYHFGSRAGLLTEVVRAMEQRQREFFAQLEFSAGAGVADISRQFWAHIADPALWPFERLYFEIYGQAVQGDPLASSLFDEIINLWLEPAVEAIERTGVPTDDAWARARVGVAVIRGLLMELLATGNRADADAAMEEFLAMYQAREQQS